MGSISIEPVGWNKFILRCVFFFLVGRCDPISQSMRGWGLFPAVYLGFCFRGRWYAVLKFICTLLLPKFALTPELLLKTANFMSLFQKKDRFFFFFLKFAQQINVLYRNNDKEFNSLSSFSILAKFFVRKISLKSKSGRVNFIFSKREKKKT